MSEVYKVLLVDDEKLITQSVEKLIRMSEKRLEVVGTAANGEVALALLGETHADIVLVDIRMPRMDGIEFLRQVREREIDTKVIVLSAYRDFEYAQQALNMGAKGYLLKPVSREKLFEALHDVEAILDQERSAKQRQLLGEQKHAVHALLEKGTILPFLPEKFLRKETQGLCLMASGENFPSTFADDCMKSGWYPLRDNQMVVPFLWQAENEFLRQLAEETRSALEEYLLADVVLTVSGEIVSQDGFQNAYNECKIANMYYFYLPQKDMIRYDEIEHFGKSTILETVKLFEHMKEQLILGTEEEIQRELNLLYEGLKNGMSINAETAHRMFSGLLLQLYQTKLPKSEKDTIPENAEIEKKLRRFITLDALFSYVKEEFLRCLENQGGMVQEADDKLITQVKVYCRENYDKVCSLDDIAEHMYISKSYLSQLFKEKTGDSIWNYFTDIRMEEAKKMLASGHVKATEVSRLLGYKNPSHFGRIFKERVGTSPKEYQQMVCR